MTLTQLEYVVALHNNKNFVQAADKCFVTQPALTIQVKNLESELGVTIFDRNKKPLETTEIGLRIIKQAVYVIQEAQKIKDVIKEYKSEIDGDLKIGIIPTLAPYLLPLFVQKFAINHPQIRLSFYEDMADNLIAKLKSGVIDVLITSTRNDQEDVKIMPLFYEKIYCYVSPGHPLYHKATLQRTDLKLGELSLLSEGNCFRNHAISICDIELEKIDYQQFEYEGSSLESLKKIVELQNGITLLPELSVNDILKQNPDMIKEIDDQHPVREICMMVNKSFVKKQLVEKLKTEILASIPEHMKTLGQMVKV